MIPQKEVQFIEWVCPKCGLLRNNKHTHVHGVKLPDAEKVVV